MENDYRITKLHGTLIGDNRIPELPDSETAKILSSANGKTAWVDLPTDVGKDANGFAVLRHDGVEIAGQRKTVKLADVRENGAVIGRDQTTSAPQTDELITKAYADKSYEGKFEVINATLTLNTEDEDGTLQLEATPSGEPYLLNINSTYHVLMAKTSQGSYLGITHDGESIILVLTNENSGLYLRYRTNRFLPVFSTETNGKFLSVVDNTPTWSDIPKGGASVSPTLNLINIEDGSVRTSITEEEKTNLEKGLYNSVIYADLSKGEAGFYSAYFPETMATIVQGNPFFSTYDLSPDKDTGVVTITGTSVYGIAVGEEKNADGTYSISIQKVINSTFGGGSTSSSSLEEATLSQLSGFKGQYKALHITDCNVVFNFKEIGEITSNSVYFVGFVNSETQLEGTVWTIFGSNPVCLGTGTFYITNGVINGGHCTIGSLNSVSVGSLFTFGGTRSFNSKDATNAIGLYGVQGCEYAGKVDFVSNGATASKSALTIISNVNKEATGESTFCEMTGLFDEYGLGRMVFKKDSDNIPQFKSFTTWLPPVTANSEGKALIVTGGNAQWTSIPESGKIKTIDATITSASGNQTDFSIVSEPNDEIFFLNIPDLGKILMTIFSSETKLYAGFVFSGAISYVVMLEGTAKSGSVIALPTGFLLEADSTQNGKFLSVVDGAPAWSDIPKYKHTVTLKTSAGAILWTQTLSNSKNTLVNSYQNLKTLFGGELLAGYGEYAQLDLHGGTEATDKLIKLDGTEATLASLGTIVYSDDCFLPK